MQITRIKAGRSTWQITLLQQIDDSTRRESKVTVAQGVDPAFSQAMTALKEHALDFVGGPELWDDEGRVTGLTCTYDDGELAGAVVSLAITIEGANGPLNLATPYAQVNDGNTGLPKEFVAAIDAALGAAETVVAQVERQEELFQ